jgi:hypothetical protein
VNLAPAALVAAARTLTLHAASAGWSGPDPYDGLWWRWPKALVAGPRRRQVVVQLHARAPVDVRRIHRRTPARIAKTLALFGSAAMRFETLTSDSLGRALALDALDTLAEDRTAGPRAWGYPFDVQTRWSYYAAGTPNVVVTAFAIIALLEGAQATGREDLAQRARDAARWVLDELWVEPEGFFAYHRGSRVNVHNASMLAAGAVSAALEDDAVAHHRVVRAVDRVVSAQNSDGSWAYGDGANLTWDDSFHTGYVLISLSRLRWIDPEVDVAVARGARHYERFFDASGRAKLWAGRRWPEDGHSAGTGLSALSALFARGHVERALLERVAARLLTAGLNGRTAVARRYRFGRTTVWYPRWCDGHVALGLADAATVLAGSTH